MSDEEESNTPEEDEGGGTPGWVMTFADLMSLLLCFFVLLLSFSEMDVIRFKKMADDMKDAFGVQKLVETDNVVKGDSVIKTHFSPGKPEPTVIKEVYQEMKEALKDAISEKQVSIEKGEDEVIVMLNDQSLFKSGSADLLDEAMPMLSKISDTLVGVPGEIRIAGHTDDLPIQSDTIRSNWDLSAMRAASVAHILIASEILAEDSIVIRGHAHTKPVAVNDSPENRAKNRRVEIHIFPLTDDPESTSKDVLEELEKMQQESSGGGAP